MSCVALCLMIACPPQPDLSGLHQQGGYLLSLERLQGRKDVYRMRWIVGSQYGEEHRGEVIGEGSLAHKYGGIYYWNMNYAGHPQQTETLHLFEGRLVPTHPCARCHPVELSPGRRR